MGRRKLIHVEDRIIKRVIFYGGKFGIAAISTKKIASDLRISEPTIYVHFKTKENLLKAAYASIMSATYATEKKVFEPLIGKREAFQEKFMDILLSLLEASKKNKGLVVFAFEYRHSASGDTKGEGTRKESEFMHSFFSSLTKDSDIRLPRMMEDKIITLAIDTIELYCYEVAVGIEEPTPMTAKIMGSMILNGTRGIGKLIESFSEEERKEFDKELTEESGSSNKK